VSSTLRDIKYGARSLLKDKGFAVTVVVTLSVCIAANTTTFAVVNSVLLRPLPVPDADAIVLMANRYPNAGVPNSNFSSAGDYYDRLREITVFDEQAMFRFEDQTVEIGGIPEQVRAMQATPSLFRLLRIAPARGRAFNDAEGEIGEENKAILSYGLWQQIYGGDPGIIGRELRLSARPYTVVGVMPRDFIFINPEVRLWTPLAFTAEQRTAYHSNNWYHAGRLKPGAGIGQAQSQIDALNAANLERFPQWRELLINAGFHTRVEPLQEMLIRDVRGVLYLLWGGSAFVLLIGILNVANLSLARFALRRKELATRLALGAGPARLTRQLIVENALLGLAAGVVGIALGVGLLRVLATVGLERLPRAHEVRMDAAVALAALAIAVLAGVFISLIPLVQIFRANLNDALHEDRRTGTGGQRARRVRQGLVVAQVGLAFVLLAGAGLLLASFRQLLQVDPGFRTEGIVTASVTAPRAKYTNFADRRTLMNRSLDALRSLPGVTAAGATTMIPFGSDYNDSVVLAEGYVMRPGESLISPRYGVVTPGYFETVGISLVRGRYFDTRDTEASLPVVIIDEWLARRFWPGRDPIGRRMYQPQGAKEVGQIDERTRWLTVVGVVGSIRLEDLAGGGSPVGAYYFPYTQGPSRSFTFAIRSSGDPQAVARSARREIAAIDSELALFDVRTMIERAELSLASRKTSMTLALGFGGIALLLSAVGIYGVLAYLVAHRRREIGIRMALGSTNAGIMKLVFREGLLLTGIGLALGLTGAVAMRRAIENEVYGVQPLDPLVIGAAIIVLGVAALAACLLPARRATQVDPVIVLSEQ
jgi:putative ABC transport system permease protein